MGDLKGTADRLEEHAELFMQAAQPARALILLAAADAVRETIGSPRSRSGKRSYEEMVAEARNTPSEGEFNESIAVGRALSLEEAVREALSP